jgi:hypothetical protein
MTPPRLIALLLLCLLLLPSMAWARGGKEVCIALLLRDATPAVAEWTAWLAPAVAHRRVGGEGETGFNLSFGAEGSFGLAELSSNRRYGGAFTLRSGPWLGASTSFDGMLGEGGLHLAFGQRSHAQWGSFTVRAGAGYGNDLGRAASHAVVMVTGGVHSFLGRYTERGACERPAPAQGPGWGSVLRLFGTDRTTLDSPRIHQWVFGLELTPSYFLPPYSLPRWGGAPP